mgnify:FL=1
MDLKKVDDLYRDNVILDHCRNPRNSEYLNNADLCFDAVNSFCGDEIHVQVNINQSYKIINIGHQTEGCAINQATGSMISEYIKGLYLDQMSKFVSNFSNSMENKVNISPDEYIIPKLGDLEILYRVKEFPIRIKCVLLSLTALRVELDNIK